MIYENENDADGITNVLHDDETDGKYVEQGIVGDQLTVITCMYPWQMDSQKRNNVLAGCNVHAEIADWHSGNRFLQVQ